LTFHYYALCIIAGITVAIWWGDKRLRSINPAYKGIVGEVAIVAVPAGIIGGRFYHVITSPDSYFGEGGRPLDALKIWQGGLGIWGAISLGAVGAWLRFRTLTVTKPSFALFMDALAPGLLVAQALGRFGNWFNGELFGPRSLRPLDSATYHPTFLYEAICNFLLAFLLIRLTTRYRDGSLFAIYVIGYCVYRFFIEGLRIDTAHIFGGLRLNQWVCLAVGAGAAIQLRRIQTRAR